jgi:hypothetical protein
VFDPELADAFVRAGERESVGRLRMREERRIEIHADLLTLGPIDPTLKMFGANLVAIDALAAEVAVEGVQIEPMRTGNQRKRLVQVGSQLVRRSRLAGIVSRHRQPAAQLFTGVFEAADVVALPTVERDRNRRESLDGRVGVDAECCVTVLGGRVGRLNRCFVAHLKFPRE